jgi:hypothetical protein
MISLEWIEEHTRMIAHRRGGNWWGQTNVGASWPRVMAGLHQKRAKAPTGIGRVRVFFHLQPPPFVLLFF